MLILVLIICEECVEVIVNNHQKKESCIGDPSLKDKYYWLSYHCVPIVYCCLLSRILANKQYLKQNYSKYPKLLAFYFLSHRAQLSFQEVFANFLIEANLHPYFAVIILLALIKSNINENNTQSIDCPFRRRERAGISDHKIARV